MKEVKPKRLSRKALVESLLNSIKKQTKLTITDVKFGDSYFLFNYGKDSICHFKIKELPEFIFGIWNGHNVNLEAYGPDFKDAELLLFTQPILTLDKFKPSRSSFLIPLSRRMWQYNGSDEWVEEWEDYSVKEMLDFMLNHRYKAFFISSNSYWDPWNYVSGFKAFKCYMTTKWEVYRQYRREEKELKKTTRAVIKSFRNLNVKAILSDFGHGYYPRLHLYFHENKEATEEESYFINVAFNYLQDNFFKSLSINEIGTPSDFRNCLKRRIAFNNSKKSEEIIVWKKI